MDIIASVAKCIWPVSIKTLEDVHFLWSTIDFIFALNGASVRLQTVTEPAEKIMKAFCSKCSSTFSNYLQRIRLYYHIGSINVCEVYDI